jgi:hypothetical protein
MTGRRPFEAFGLRPSSEFHRSAAFSPFAGNGNSTRPDIRPIIQGDSVSVQNGPGVYFAFMNLLSVLTGQLIYVFDVRRRTFIKGSHFASPAGSGEAQRPSSKFRAPSLKLNAMSDQGFELGSLPRRPESSLCRTARY